MNRNLGMEMKRCWICNMYLRANEMLEHFVIVHDDKGAARQLEALNKLSRRGT